MNEINVHLKFQVFGSTEDLIEADRILLESAQQVLIDAYAPYSAYQVGAAVLLDNGEVVTGSNQENVAYPSGLCAERVALFYASSRFPDAVVKSIAVAAHSKEFKIKDTVSPCGACRQVLAETEKRFDHPIRVIMQGKNKEIIVTDGINNLLPMMFHADELKKYTNGTDIH